MKIIMSPPPGRFWFLFLLFFPAILQAQMITGTWRGRINRQKAEVKIIQKGDSLTGTSYYYESANHYRRYSIKGYFDARTNEAVWWDDQLLVAKSGRLSIGNPGKIPLLSSADFNCPGDGRMMLDGRSGERDKEDAPQNDLHLDKIRQSMFEDEWDFVIDNYTLGANDPRIIDSIGTVALVPVPELEEEGNTIVLVAPAPKPEKTVKEKKEPVILKPEPEKKKPAENTAPPPLPQPGIEEKFMARQKQFTREIPLAGDSIELRFYDNAEIDGDSISLFLNNRLLYQHIRLTGQPYIIKLALADLETQNELVMVAENLGAIPPNTAYLAAFVNGIRHEAYLASTEGSSAMIRLVKLDPNRK